MQLCMSFDTSKKKISNTPKLPRGRVVIPTAAAMRTFGSQVARAIVARAPGSQASVIALYGDLGAGKTTFTQGFLSALGVRRRGISPTFLIIRPYSIQKKNYTRVLHIDCYRLQNAEELVRLGFTEAVNDSRVILVIEWPEIAKELLPSNTLHIRITHPKRGTRRTVICENEV